MTLSWPALQRLTKGNEQTGQAIFNARDRFPEASLADLYDELAKPSDLRQAHQANDKGVWEVYGKVWPLDDEPACVAYLMELNKEYLSSLQ